MAASVNELSGTLSEPDRPWPHDARESWLASRYKLETLMASKKPSGPAWQMILEEMRSQNRATIEAVEAFRGSLEERIERLDRESRDRDGTLVLAIAGIRREVRQNSTDITGLRREVEQNTTDIADLKVTVKESTVELRTLANKVDVLNRLEERVAALEGRAAG